MQQNNNDLQNIAEDEISLKELILKIKDWYRFLISKWIVLVAAAIIGAAIGVAKIPMVGGDGLASAEGECVLQICTGIWYYSSDLRL